MSTARDFLTWDESIAQLIQQLGEGEPKVLSHLSEREHAAIAVAAAFNEWAEIDILDKLIAMYLTLSPARGGRSRKQLTSIGIASMGSPQNENSGILGWFRRRVSRDGDR